MTLIYHIEEDSPEALRDRIVKDWGKELILGRRHPGDDASAAPGGAPSASAEAPSPSPRRGRGRVTQAAQEAPQEPPVEEPVAPAPQPPAEPPAAPVEQPVEIPAAPVEEPKQAPAPTGPAPIPEDPTPEQVREAMAQVIAKHEAKLGAVRMFLDQHASGAKNISSIATPGERRAVIAAARQWLLDFEAAA